MATKTDVSKEEMAKRIVEFMDDWHVEITPPGATKENGAEMIVNQKSWICPLGDMKWDRNLLAEVLGEIEANKLHVEFIQKMNRLGATEKTGHDVWNFLMAESEEILEAIYLTLKEHGDD